MPKITLTPDVRKVAQRLGVPLRGDVADEVVRRCLATVSGWCEQLGMPGTLADLLALVQAKLCLHFEVIETSGDIENVRRRYLKQNELAFVNLDKEFRSGTDALVYRLEHAKPWSNVRYVAVVDGRGGKSARVWFSKWHEIAHILAEPQTTFVFRRTPAFKREPIERLMDQIAGALAFYEPIFKPLLKNQAVDLERPTLASLQRFASGPLSFASLHATLQAALNHTDVPSILIEAKPQYSKAQQAEVASSNGSVVFPPLRAVTTGHNPAAMDARFFIHRNMRVPPESVIARVYDGGDEEEFLRMSENLSWWESQGMHLVARPMDVEAMHAGSGRVIALCTTA